MSHHAGSNMALLLDLYVGKNIVQSCLWSDTVIALSRYAADPVLNRGVVLESLGRYEEAASDYEAVLSAQPNDPAAWNNLGNVQVCFTAFTNVWEPETKVLLIVLCKKVGCGVVLNFPEGKRHLLSFHT
jgi:tetratricopeptide (TPR) repeat protein